jgi:crotonobetainyl-CoA:carnitine CoA-transferase CaiB-like acyl-CoA transferase
VKLLSGIKVLVLADRLVDFGGSILARLGAEVVLLETDQDPTDAQVSAWWKGMEVSSVPISSFLSETDIVLDDRRSCFERPDVDDLIGEHEQVIHVVATGWPEGSPQRQVTDLTLMAQSGLMKVTGSPDKPPLRLPGQQAYALTGIQVATAALHGLRARRHTGKGQRISVSALQSAALANYREAVMYDWTGRVGTRRGNMLVRGKSGVRQIWPCADGFVTWSMIDNPGMMYSIVGAMSEAGAAGELADVDWDNILVADTDQETIERWQGIVAAFFASRSREALAELSLKQGWGLSPIVRLEEVPRSPQMQARGVFEASENGSLVPGPLFAVHGLEKEMA